MNIQQVTRFPKLIEVTQFETGFVAKMNESSSYYENFDILVQAVQPSIRREFESCKGNC